MYLKKPNRFASLTSWAHPITGLAFVSLLGGALLVSSVDAAQQLTQTKATTATAPQNKSAKQAAADYATLPLHFEANRGQVSSEVRYLSRGPGYTLWLTNTRTTLVLTSASLKTTSPILVNVRLKDSNPHAQWEGRSRLLGQVNYLKGSDPKDWHTHIPTYGNVVKKAVYHGIDLIYHGSPQHLEFDFVVAPGIDPRRIAMAFDGIENLTIDRQGDLLLTTDNGGHLRQRKPVVYQLIEGNYEIRSDNSIGFQVATYDTNRSLIIDPVLDYSTYLGGEVYDTGLAIDVDDTGAAYVSGITTSLAFPNANGAQPTLAGKQDTFVAKLTPNGNALVYATYLGGSKDEGEAGQIGNQDEDDDVGPNLAVDSQGQVVLTGTTGSPNDFPLVNALQPTYGGGPRDAYVVKLSADGSTLLFST